MIPTKFMDRRMTELSPSTICIFPYFSDFHEEDEEDEEDHLFSGSTYRSIPDSISMDRPDSPKIAYEKVGTSYDGALISVIDEKMKENTDHFLHVVHALIKRLSQLESRTCNIESYVDDLKVSAEYNHGRTDGKLRQLENTLREIQGGVQDLRDKQEIAEAQLQLAKHHVSKGKLQVENQISATQVRSVHGISSAAPRQIHLPLPVHVSCQQPLPSLLYASPSLNNQNLPPPPPRPPVSAAVELPTQINQNQISISDPGSYSLPQPMAPGTTHPQCQMPLVPQTQVSSSVPHQPYQPTPQSQTSQLPSSPNVPPHLSTANSQVPPSGHPPKDIPYMSSQSYTPSFHQPPFQLPTSAPSTTQLSYNGSTLKKHEEPQSRPNSEFPTGYGYGYGYGTPPAYAHSNDFYACSGSKSHSNDSTLRHPQFSPLPFVPSGGTSYPQLPTAKILPHALPTASSVDGGSGPRVTGNKISSDDVVDKVAAMGFRRDLVRATAWKLTENGQRVDLNAVLDKLMTDGEDQAQRVKFSQ